MEFDEDKQRKVWFVRFNAEILPNGKRTGLVKYRGKLYHATIYKDNVYHRIVAEVDGLPYATYGLKFDKPKKEKIIYEQLSFV